MDFLNILLSILNIHDTNQSIDTSNKSIIDEEGANAYWFGATDQGNEGDWYWINSRKPVSDFIWEAGNSHNTTTTYSQGARAGRRFNFEV